MVEPSAPTVHHIHDRFLVEIVEGFGLCPFARRSREQGRVHRPLFWTEEPVAPSEVAQVLARTHHDHPDAEIILLTFVDRPGRFTDLRTFDAFVVEVRAAHAALTAAPYFMVAFHPSSGSDLPPDRPLTKDGLVPLLRRSPDPVIQCVHAEVLTQVRAQAQRAARKRMLEAVEQLDPRLRVLLENSIQTDSALSADIAQANFESVGSGPLRAQLEQRLDSIRHERRELYGF